MKISKHLVIGLSEMPDGGLIHSSQVGDEDGLSTDFDIMKSELMTWLVGQAEIRKWLFQVLRKKGVIEYAKETRKWKAAKGKMEAWDPPVKGVAVMTPDEALEVLIKRDGASDAGSTYREWRECCQKWARHNKPGQEAAKISHWSFYHIIGPLVEGGRVFKYGLKWVAGGKEERKRLEMAKINAMKAKIAAAEAEMNRPDDEQWRANA